MTFPFTIQRGCGRAAVSRCTGAQRRDERLIRHEGERRNENCQLRAAGDIVIRFSSWKAADPAAIYLQNSHQISLAPAFTRPLIGLDGLLQEASVTQWAATLMTRPVRGGDAMQRRGCRLIFHQTPPTAAIARCRPSLLAGPPSARVGGGRTCCLTPCQHRYESTVSVLLNCKWLFAVGWLIQRVNMEEVILGSGRGSSSSHRLLTVLMRLV